MRISVNTNTLSEEEREAALYRESKQNLSIEDRLEYLEKTLETLLITLNKGGDKL